MKKLFLSIALVCLLTIIFIPVFANAVIVPCGNPGQNSCTICDFFQMLTNIYRLLTFVETLIDKKEKKLAINWDDEIVKGTALTRDGAIIHPNFMPKTSA